MRQKILVIISSLFLLFTTNAFALLNLELTRGVAGAVPIAIVPFAGDVFGGDISDVVSNDLKNSGQFKVYGKGELSSDTSLGYYKKLGADHVVTGTVKSLGGNRYEVAVRLADVFKSQNVLLNQKFVVGQSQARTLAHHISDLIYEKILGIRGVFSTKLAYVLVQPINAHASRYLLEISDQDGFNPHPLLTSFDPIMSPAWSPTGKEIAYVSFENRKASIYIEDIRSGARRLVSQYPGINGAPAWSPDGTKLALVLSKSGSPNIFILNLNTRHIMQMTNDFSINTEPAWAPDGQSLLFTSNRGGGPQIYKLDIPSHKISRISYDGTYNARASYTRDGSHIVMLNNEGRLFNIGVLDLDSGSFRVLTNSGADNESPSIAPNGSMVLFGTRLNNHNVLGMASIDGRVQITLPSRNGEVQDPAWSPFL